MYRLLIIAQPTITADPAQWSAQQFAPVDCCASVEEALRILGKKAYDAVGASTETEYVQLAAELKKQGNYTPAFLLPQGEEDRQKTLKDVRHLLHRLHVDYTDEQYSLYDLSTLIQNEMLHNLISGKLQDPNKLCRWFRMLRSEIPLESPCRVYDLSLPQGDLYLADRWHHGQLRLEKALEWNFFGHIPELAWCAVSFLNPVEARLLLIPNAGIDLDERTDALDSAVIHAVNDIKAYLDLDIDVYQAGTAACLTDIAITTKA